jgi:hypothetical protein
MNLLILLSFTHLTLPYNGEIFSCGTAFSTLINEPENLFWNPAGMGKNAYIASAYSYSGNIFGSFGKIWEKDKFNIGFGVQIIHSESMAKTDMTGTHVGEFNYQSVTPVIAGNWKRDKYFLGAKILLPYTAVDEYVGYGLGIDIGGIYALNEMLFFSFYLRNFGKQIKAFIAEKEDFPVESRFGGLLKKGNLALSLEYSSKFRMCSFASYDINKILGFTVGYNGRSGRLDGIETSNLTGLSFGANIDHKSIEINLGTVLTGAEGLTKSLSISFIP